MITAAVAALGLPALTVALEIWAGFRWNRRAIKAMEALRIDLTTCSPAERQLANDTLTMWKRRELWP
jgi:hypothetical protein